MTHDCDLKMSLFISFHLTQHLMDAGVIKNLELLSHSQLTAPVISHL